jgi:2-furoyl-CoA dehydrogenase FAD binding subunit
MLNMHLVNPRVLVDISRIGEFDYIREADGFVEVGAATTQARLLEWPELRRKVPLLAQAMPHIGHFQTRNRGTVCGSLSHADPSSELPLALATLGGEVVLRNRRKQRRLKAAEFQTGMLSTARDEDEIVVAARFPVAAAGTGYAFHEVADRPVVRAFDGLEGDALDDALNAFAWELGATDDIHASARYRREMVRRIGRKVIGEARNAAA